MSFVHLHTHSHYSLLTGLGKIPDLLDRAKELGMDTIALTDYSNLYGAVELTTMAKDRDMKVIIGAELFVAYGKISDPTTSDQAKINHNITLLVKNEKGYKNLMKLITKAQLDGFTDKPRVDKDLLREYHEGLIALSGCLDGEIPQALSKDDYTHAKKIALEYVDIFGKENFYLEMQDHPRVREQGIANKGLIKLSGETGIELVATGDIHYIKPEDAPTQDILLCIKNNRKVYENDRVTMEEFDMWMKSPEEMAEAFKETPQAVENTQKIADQCDFNLKLGEISLPYYPLPAGETPSSALRKMTKEKLTKFFQGRSIPKEYQDRVDYELDIIDKMGYPDYFLIVQDFINWARSQNIVVGPGRGSAAGSLVSYLIGITNLDPIKYTLLFERFLNPERISMPDVDMDFADVQRDDVLDYCREKYGWDHVAHIITFGTMAGRAAIRDVGRALGLSYGFCDQVAKMIPTFTSLKETLENVPEFKDLYTNNSDAKNLIDNAIKLEGVCRHASIHACGVVITRDPVVEYTPIQRVSGSDHAVCTQYSSSTKTSYVEKVGLLKMDFLGLKNLTIIQNTLRIIKKVYGEEIDIEKIPLDDVSTYELLQRGETTGVFQLESSGMKRYLKLLKPTVFEDIIAMVALYRPGPMEWIPDFIDGKHGKKKVEYLHPKLEPILSNTYGVAVYQEQVMQITQALAGFTLGEADILRKAMGKKIMELIHEQKIKFIEGCEKTGVGKNIGEKVFTFIEPFAGYGFNRSHAACYALIGYQTAHLKAHYPAAFMAALLTSDQDDLDRIAIEVSECKDMGIEVLPPNINESFEEFAVILHKKEMISSPSVGEGVRGWVAGAKLENNSEENSLNAPSASPTRHLPLAGEEAIHSPLVEQNPIIRFGLNAIKNVGHPVAKAIVAERKANGKFTSIADFIQRIQTKDLNKRSLDALAKVGGFDDVDERNHIVQNMETILAFSKSLREQKDSNQESLFSAIAFEPVVLNMQKSSPANKHEKLTWEKQLLGLYVSDHPTSDFRDYFEKATTPIPSIGPDHVQKTITVGGIIQNVKKIYVKDNKPMAFVMIENITGKIELVVFPKTYEKTQAFWEADTLVTATGRVSDKDGQYKILAEDVKILSEEEIEILKRIEATKRKYSRDDSDQATTSKEQLAKEQDVKKKGADSSPSTGGLSARSTTKAGGQGTDTAKHHTITIPTGTSKEALQNLSNYLAAQPKGEIAISLNVSNQNIKTSFSIEIQDTFEKEVEAILNV